MEAASAGLWLRKRTQSQSRLCWLCCLWIRFPAALTCSTPGTRICRHQALRTFCPFYSWPHTGRAERARLPTMPIYSFPCSSSLCSVDDVFQEVCSQSCSPSSQQWTCSFRRLLLVQALNLFWQATSWALLIDAGKAWTETQTNLWRCEKYFEFTHAIYGLWTAVHLLIRRVELAYSDFPIFTEGGGERKEEKGPVRQGLLFVLFTTVSLAPRRSSSSQ